jgi:FkbM family methyltransferase
MASNVNSYFMNSWYFTKFIGKLMLRPQLWKLSSSQLRNELELVKIVDKPRYTTMAINLFGKKFEIVDSMSFLWTYNDIFKLEIYKFISKNARPLIIDCGANIGVSILYFKTLYPDSKIIAFEPDINIFNTLDNNMKNFGFTDIKLIRKALWDSETVLEFTSEGGDAGRLFQSESPTSTYQVQTVRLRDYLDQPVDLLKIDIEGAETTVIEDCWDRLCNVDKLFVEYHSFANKNQSLNTLINVLSKSGFRLYIQPLSKSAHPFVEREVYNGIDMQLNIFAWRE